jgi:hypothetical protein
VSSRGPDETTRATPQAGAQHQFGRRREMRAQRKAESPGWGSGLRPRQRGYCGDARC